MTNKKRGASCITTHLLCFNSRGISNHMNSKQNQKNSKLPVMGIPAQPVKPNYRRTFPQVHSYVTKVDV